MSYPRAFLRLTTNDDINTVQSQVQSLDPEYLQIPPFEIAAPSNKYGFSRENDAGFPVLCPVMMPPEVPRPVLKASLLKSLETNKVPEKSCEPSSFVFPVGTPNYCTAEISASRKSQDNYKVLCGQNEAEASIIEKHVEKGKNKEHRENGGHIINACKEFDLAKDKNLDNHMCLRQAGGASQARAVGLKAETSDDDWEAISIGDAVDEIVDSGGRDESPLLWSSPVDFSWFPEIEKELIRD